MMANSSAPGSTAQLAPPNNSLVSRLNGSDNALNTVRLALAILVILSHTIAIAGASRWPAWIGGLGGLAVAGFFALSGYLIAGSRLRSSWWAFAIRRVARIYPGYWAQLIVVACGFALLATVLGPSTWSMRAAGDYMLANVTTFGLRYQLDGTRFPHFGAWNGSAWTLMYELIAYAGCLILFWPRWCRRHVTPISGTVLTLLVAFDLLAPVLDVTTSLYLHLGHLGSYFAAGILAFGLRMRIRVSFPLTAVAIVLVLILFFVPGGMSVAQLPLVYALLSLGALVPVRIGAQNDLSYGTYIYGFPVQQVVTMAGVDRWGGIPHAMVSIIIALAFAWASWRLIERPTMNWARCLIDVMRQGRRVAGERRGVPASVALPEPMTGPNASNVRPGEEW